MIGSDLYTRGVGAVRDLGKHRMVREALQLDWNPWVAEHGSRIGRVGKQATVLAVAEVTAQFGKSGLRGSDGIQNTIRHTFWSGLLTQQFWKHGGTSVDEARGLARSWSNLHERVGGDRAVDVAVDMANNHAGSQLGAELVREGMGSLPFLKLRRELMSAVIDAWDAGKLSYWSAAEDGGRSFRATRPEDLSSSLRQHLLR